MLIETLSAAPSGNSNGAPWVVYLIAGLFVIFGVALAIKPQLQWKMNRWAYKNPAAMEPSAKGLIATRISGIAMVGMAIVIVIVAISKS